MSTGERPAGAAGRTGGSAAPPAERTASAAGTPPPLDFAGGLAALRGLLARPLASYYLLISSAGLLLVIGLTMVFSASSVTAYVTDGSAFAGLRSQATFAVIGLVLFWVCQRLPVRTYRAIARLVLIFAIGLLALLGVMTVARSLTEVDYVRFGPIGAGLLSLSFGPLSLQPGEIAKLALVIWGADVLARKGESLGYWRELAVPLFPVVGLLFLLVGYNDLGTMLCLLALLVGLLWAAGVRLRVFATLSVVGLAGIGLLIAAASLGAGSGATDDENYRLARLTSFLTPPEDCDVAGCYQALQARYAMGNGGWFGVGLGTSRLKWGYVPEAHNDFIFAILAEELGVVGCVVVLALFAVLAYTGLRIARRVTDPFRRLAAAGVTAWLVGQAVINIGGVVGLLPITGLPLPFISDGGSALVVTLAAVGMLASFARAEPDAARALHARPPARWVRLVWAPLPPLPDGRKKSAATGPPPRAGERGSGRRRD